MSTHIRKVGVFDSGVGGLSVLRAFLHHFPQLDYVYWGDSARAPYGNRSGAQIRRLAEEDVQRLLAAEVDAIVIACNTVTAYALPSLQAAHPDLPFLGTIPAIAQSLAQKGAVRLGLLATEATLASGAYPKALRACNPQLRLQSMACPEWVPLIEANRFGTEAAQRLVETTLTPWDPRALDGLLLGCTHYPLLRKEIQTVWPTCPLYDPADAMVNEATAIFPAPTADEPVGQVVLWTSGDATLLARIAQRVLPRPADEIRHLPPPVEPNAKKKGVL